MAHHEPDVPPAEPDAEASALAEAMRRAAEAMGLLGDGCFLCFLFIFVGEHGLLLFVLLVV